MSRKIVIVALVAAMALMLSGLAWVDEGSAKPEGQRADYLKQGIMQQLTPEQREQLKDMIAELKEDGASKEEIREAVVEQLKEWGVERPQRPGNGIFQQLTPEQREQLKDMIAELKEDGASKEEIHKAVVEQLKEWGVERPQRPDNVMFQQLTPEQREQLKDMIAELKEDGASKEEIREAVVEQLKEWGVGPKPQE